ncbi:MAG: ATPase, T2SS/T4P/T4SS family, partial [Gemmataceae bacterium]
TGHLVYSTLHTGDAVGALDRMIGVFAAEEQTSIRNQLSMVLRAVVAQRLLPAAGGSGRVPATEILRINTAVAHLIRTGKPQQIYSSMELGSTQGMQTMEQGLADLVMRKLVDVEDARKLARDERLFEERLRLRMQAGATPARNHTNDGAGAMRRPVR